MTSTPDGGLHYFHPDWISDTDERLTADVCIYGGSSAGCAAAYTAAGQGLSVVLLQPGKHLGGLTSGGLGWTDFGRKHVIGGLSRRFYKQAGEHYGHADGEEEWRFEPKVAEAIFERWIAESDVTLRRCQYLDGVEMDGQRITAITLLGGLRVQAKAFIDASYEGDLLAKAGVAHHIGREANSVYGETLNGIQVRDKHQFSVPVDPYVTPGDPGSGLLPQVEDVDLRRHQGEGDQRVQAYNFRVCMTDDPALKIDWAKPEGFDALQQELAVRWFNAVEGVDDYNNQVKPHLPPEKDVPHQFDIFTNKTPGGFYKTDTNNHGPVSSDFIGANWAWPEASYEQREQLFQRHVAYQKGFYWTIANDPRVPERYRTAYSRWGLPSDEFTDTGHWPHQLYVRESRRMVGGYVVTEADCMRPEGFTAPNDSVGMGSYTLDSHNCTRFVGEVDGQVSVMNDGDVQVPPTDPYPISYRAIVPAAGQAANLLAPICISASHIAYGSARMEPVFMVLGESAALAASIAIRDAVSVQDVPYARLRPMLDAAEQVLY
jgi:hypothetical protein